MISRKTQVLILLGSALLGPAASAERAAMLVTNKSCPMGSISMLDVRKAYFSVPVSFEGQPVRAFRYTGDEQLARIFHQTVVAMSERSYQRRLLSMALKYGSPRPVERSTIPELVSALHENRCGITYMWADDIGNYSELKSLRLLWQGD